MHKVSLFHRLITNSFGVLGYLFATIEWVWLVAVGLPLLLQSHVLEWALPKPEHHPAHSTLYFSLPGPGLLIMASIITAAMIALTIYVLIKVPMTAIKSTSKIAHQTADQLVPTIVHHKKISQKRARRLSAQLFFYLKLIFACLPVALSFLALLAPKLEISFALLLFVASSLGLVAVVCYTLQLIFGQWFRLEAKRLL